VALILTCFFFGELFKHEQLQAITPIRNDIIKSLSLYYYTFVDLLDFKDQVCELLTTMDACQVNLDIVSIFFLLCL